MTFNLPIKANDDELSSAVDLKNIRLTDLIYTSRAACLITRDQYYECSQHNSKMYDWDGFFLKFGEHADIPSSVYVPLKRRRPSARLDLPTVIVDNLTAIVFGKERFPGIRIEGDSDAEDFAQELCKQSSFQTKMIEARNKGGATGTAVISWGFVEGNPILEIHDAQQCEVLEWADYNNRKPKKIIKVYTYKRKIWDEKGKPQEKIYFYARYWDEQIDICWRDIPEKIAATQNWWKCPSKMVSHRAGFCPVYWVQNYANSSDIDGKGDYSDGSLTNFDQIDILLSSTVKGTIANVDPTLIIHEDEDRNDGPLRKGSDYAIYCKGGAEYLELEGSAVDAALKVIEKLRQVELDKAGVVILDQEKTGGSALSAAAMKQRYAVMLVKAGLLREQYGKAIIAILKDMLEISRNFQVVQHDETGVEYWSKIELPLKIEYVENDDIETGDKTVKNEGRAEKVVKKVERKPGNSSNISLEWPAYFPPSWEDKKQAVETIKAATDGKQIMSQRKGVQNLQSLFDGDDTEIELAEIDADIERSLAKKQELIEIKTAKSSFENGEN
jgi:hypothetical protein